MSSPEEGPGDDLSYPSQVRQHFRICSELSFNVLHLRMRSKHPLFDLRGYDGGGAKALQRLRAACPKSA